MSGKQRFFFYGQLKNFAKPDEVYTQGQLRERPDDDCAAVFSRRATGKVWGQVHEESAATEKKIAKMEKSDEYRRVVVKLSDGSHAYAWEFAGPTKQWDSFRVIKSGHYTKADESK